MTIDDAVLELDSLTEDEIIEAYDEHYLEHEEDFDEAVVALMDDGVVTEFNEHYYWTQEIEDTIEYSNPANYLSIEELL